MFDNHFNKFCKHTIREIINFLNCLIILKVQYQMISKLMSEFEFVIN